MKDQHEKKQEDPGEARISIGLEKLLVLAASDPEFKRELMSDRESALTPRDFALRPFEESVLKATSNKQLEAMIDSVAPTLPRRRKMVGLVAAATTTLAVGTLLANSSCGSAPVAGSRPEVDYPQPPDTLTDSASPSADGGVDTDAGPEATDAEK